MVDAHYVVINYLILHILFSPKLRLTPRSTLFPYTTLFRSRSCSGVKGAGRRHSNEATPFLSQATAPPSTMQDMLRHRDRKSTRLNSSHVAISYAVFCLKKKTQIPNKVRTIS